ncbi:MAG: Epoxyqueuosine reductase [Turneriella sp.]|nr:Epoxyqueuosine reductase [Turneriella sp.]
MTLTLLQEAATALGFSRVAALPITQVEDEFRVFYEEYLTRCGHADLKYLERPERFTLTAIYPNAKTLLIFLYPYRFRSVEAQLRAAPYKIARYAWQKDYHYLLKEKLNALLEKFNWQGRAVTDSAPVLEKYWARRAGMGFIGLNSLLIDPLSGSYFLIASLFIDEKLQPDLPRRDLNSFLANDFHTFCKDCTLCIDACPTSALSGDGLMDTQKCISYQSIETKEAAVYPEGTKKHRWIFGCDICQQVCPYNKNEKSYSDEKFNETHPAIPLVASGEDTLTRSEIKGSVLERRGMKKVRENKEALEKF